MSRTCIKWLILPFKTTLLTGHKNQRIYPAVNVMFLALHPMESISLNSYVLLEQLAMLLTSTLAINC